MPTAPLGFDLHLDHDRFLCPADRELHGILTVTARAATGLPAAGADHRAPAGVGEAAGSTVGARARPAAPPTLAQARLRIRTVAPNRVLFCRQVHPAVRDLAGVPVDDRTVDHPTGPWGEERREYHLCLAVDGTDRPRGEDLLAARIDLLVEETAQTPPVAALVHWTDDLDPGDRVDLRVAQRTAAEELASAAEDERHDGEDPSVAGPLGRAVRLAAVAGDTRRLEELGLLVDVTDPATGRVRLPGDRYPPDSGGSPYAGHDEPAASDGAAAACRCGHRSPPGVRFCERCGGEFGLPSAADRQSLGAPGRVAT